MTPLVLITGFLGSGKTTLLNQLIRTGDQQPGRFAVVVNEFGDVGIDGDLIPEVSARQVELPGGCICCQLDEDLEKTLMELTARNPELGWIFVETTGLAEPLPISWTLAREPLSERVRLAAILTLVDAANHMEHRTVAPSIDNQVEYADLLAVTKLDLVGGTIPEPLAAELESRNQAGAVLVLDQARMAQGVWEALRDPPWEARARPAAGDHRHALNGFTSVAVEIREILDFEELTEQLEQLPRNYVRIKGIAQVVDESTGSAEPHYKAFHRVGARVSGEVVSGTPEPRMVALGPDIEAEPLAACIEASVLRSS